MALPDLLDTWNRLTDAIYYGNDVASGTLVPSSRTISTTAPITGGGDLSANRTIGITLTGGGSGAVGTGRTIATTAPLTGGGTLAADLTLALTTSPVSQTPVGVTRSINTTAPLAGGGNLSADRTLTVAAFTGAVDGVVTHNPSGVQGKYLKDDNTWGSSSTAGVTDLSADPPINVDAATGSVTVSVDTVSIADDGVVPATGGTDATKFLCATNPVSWAVPGLGGFVTLQGSTPGTADVGSAHIDGTLIAEDSVVAGATTGVGTGVIESISDAGLFGFFSRASGAVASPSIWMQRSLGTLAAPTATTANTVLGSLLGTGYSTNNHWSSNLSAGIQVKADGNAASTEQPAYTDVIAGSVGVPAYLRLSSVGARISAGSTPGSSVRALSTLDVIGSLGLKVTSKTASFTCDAASTHYLLDCTSAIVDPTLPDATTCANRVYAFTKIDDTFRRAAIVATPRTINGNSGMVLRSQFDSVIMASNGSNWYTLACNFSNPQETARADATAVGASSTAEAQASTAYTGYLPMLSAGTKIYLRARGVYSTNATPTLHFRVRGEDIGGSIIADFFTFTTPSGMTNAYWDICCDWTVRTLALGAISTSMTGPCVLRYGDANGLLVSYGTSTIAPPGAGLTATPVITAQFGTSHASNTVTVKDFSVGYVPFTAT